MNNQRAPRLNIAGAFFLPEKTPPLFPLPGKAIYLLSIAFITLSTGFTLCYPANYTRVNTPDAVAHGAF